MRNSLQKGATQKPDSCKVLTKSTNETNPAQRPNMHVINNDDSDNPNPFRSTDSPSHEQDEATNQPSKESFDQNIRKSQSIQRENARPPQETSSSDESDSDSQIQNQGTNRPNPPHLIRRKNYAIPTRGSNLNENRNSQNESDSDHDEPSQNTSQNGNSINRSNQIRQPSDSIEFQSGSQNIGVSANGISRTSAKPIQASFKTGNFIRNNPKEKPEPVYYYIYKVFQELISPKFFRVPTIIKFDEEFQIKIFLDFFKEYDKKFDNLDFKDSASKLPNYQQYLTSFCNEKLKQYNNFYNFLIEWMTVSNTDIEIHGVCVKSKIQLTAKSTLIACYSIFEPQDLSKTESSVEVFANSKAIFINCHFHDSPRVAVIARNYSTVTFVNCVFDGNRISCFVMDDSLAQFINCKFTNDENISVFVTKDSKAQMSGNVFKGVKGKAIFAKDSSKVYITNTVFDHCVKGAATIAEGSFIYLDNIPDLNTKPDIRKDIGSVLKAYNIDMDVTNSALVKYNRKKSNEAGQNSEKYNVQIINSGNTALRAINKSLINAREVEICETEGNAINIENSNGYFFDCNISKTVHPTIAVIGRKANPFFYNCNLLENQNTFCVICKNCCRPLFMNCHFKQCSTNCVSISDFSRPHLENCTFKEIQGKHLNAFSGSGVTYHNLREEDGKDININLTPTTFGCEEKSIQDVLKSDIKEQEENNVPNDNDDEDQPRVKSWRSPTYDVPADVTVMAKPVLQDEELAEFIKKSFNINGPLRFVDIMQIINKFDNVEEVEFICSHCSHKIEDEYHIFIPCGHAICQNCMGLYQSNDSKCPICNSPIKEIKKIFKEDECSICLDKVADTISLPCAHLCMCYECASKCSEKNFNCPMCNEPLSSYKYVFKDIKENSKNSDGNTEDND